MDLVLHTFGACLTKDNDAFMVLHKDGKQRIPPADVKSILVMYDIEDNRVRNQVVKYLLKKGCSRIQKSIFLGNTEHTIYAQIKDDLTAVQECYENHDSIILVPISTDYLQVMRIIGKNIDIDILLKNKNTLFF